MDDPSLAEANLARFGTLTDLCKETVMFSLARQPEFDEVPIMREGFLAAIRRRRPRVLIMDIAKAQRFGGVGLAMFAEVLKAMRKPGLMFLLNVGSQVRGFIEISDLSDLFKIVDDLPEAERLAILKGTAVPVDGCPEAKAKVYSNT